MGKEEIRTNTQQLRHRVAYMERIAEISRDLNSTLSLEPLLQRIVAGAKELTEAEACSIILLDKNSQQLRFAQSTNLEEARKLKSLTIPSSSIAGHVVRTGELIRVQDTKGDERWSPDVDRALRFDTRSMIALPMGAQGAVIGVMELINKTNGEEFSEDDVNIAATLAANAAVAIENARLMGALQLAYDNLSELDNLKNDFVSIASHELRTPLSVILTYSSMLEEQLEGDQRRQIQLVLDNAIKLRSITDDLINLRHVDTGQASIETERFDVHTLVQEVLSEFNQIMKAKAQRVFHTLPPSAVELEADRRKVRLVLANLFSNAVKFTPREGRIHLAVTYKNDEVWFSVSDTGVGVDNSEQERIFERFYQVEGSLDRAHEGLGLGLSTAKSMVELHGGRIWVESVPGQGSCFTFTVPQSHQADS